MAKFNIWKEYEKAAKYIAKFDTMYINRDGEQVLVSNGHFLVKINIGIYNEIFRTVSPRFIDIKDGEQVAAHDKKQLPTAGNVDLFVCVPKNNEVVYNSDITGFILEKDGNNILSDLRVCFVNGSTMYVNNEYYSMLKVFFSGLVLSGGVRKGIYSEFDRDTAAFILPVNANYANTGRFQVVDALENTNRMSA